jgi:hypothetical protein
VRVSAADRKLQISRKMALGNTGMSPSNWVAKTGWFVFLESDERAWAYDGDKNLVLVQITPKGSTVYGPSNFPCPVPEAVFVRLKEDAKKLLSEKRWNDRIDSLVKRLSAGPLRTPNSFYPSVSLAPSATPQEVLDRLHQDGFGEIRDCKACKLVFTKKVSMVVDHVPVKPDGAPEHAPVFVELTAAFVETDLGDLIVLMRPEKLAGGGNSWWTQVYESGGDGGGRFSPEYSIHLGSGRFRCNELLAKASALQSMGRQEALEKLHDMTRVESSNDLVIALCRMLFTPRAGAEFHRPKIGGAQFLGGTDYADWPLEPLEIVSGIPFLIVRGYVVAGEPEPAENYLRYCEQNCDWSAVRYHYSADDRKEKANACATLMASRKWKRPLNEDERKWLLKQID